MSLGSGVQKTHGSLWHGAGTPPIDQGNYQRLFPYYAELAALSELRKKPGFGAPIASGIGGHSLLYLNGVRRDRGAGYPVLELCAPDANPGQNGVGISVNSHYRNANWVAAEGYDFLWHGTLKPGEPLTRAAYTRTQQAAMASGVLDGVQFHPKFFEEKPDGMAERDFMYEISVATDYAACFGRDTFRTRIPLDAARMGAIVDYLNALNMPYRQGRRAFDWSVFNNNCCHIAHNALAVAGIWKPWPTGQFLPFAAFKFPVPKNELVDLSMRGNDLPIQNAQAMFGDKLIRRNFLATGALPTAPGALAIAEPAMLDNEVYDVERLKLIFFDNPFWGPYRFRFARIFDQKRYTDLRANLLHFAAVYEIAGKQNDALGGTGKSALFQSRYNDYIAAQVRRVKTILAGLDTGAQAVAEPVH